jgi:hypothetical protein
MIRISIRQNVAEVLAQYRRDFDRSRAAIRHGVRNARPATDAILKAEARQVFKVRDPRMDRSWRVYAPRDANARLVIMNLMRGFELHATGGTITPRGGSQLLIPINTRLGSRIGTKKFYSMIAWLRREKLTIIRNGVLYVRVPMNTSRRGGVAAGTRVQKKFRSRFQGSLKRPSGFDIKLNPEGLTPIAVVKRSISMRKRFNMDQVVRARLLPALLDSIRIEMDRLR